MFGRGEKDNPSDSKVTSDHPSFGSAADPFASYKLRFPNFEIAVAHEHCQLWRPVSKEPLTAEASSVVEGSTAAEPSTVADSSMAVEASKGAESSSTAEAGSSAETSRETESSTVRDSITTAESSSVPVVNTAEACTEAESGNAADTSTAPESTAAAESTMAAKSTKNTVSKCVHNGCNKRFRDEDEPCNYHPGSPIFHEGQKGWRCCKPRVLTFDEFLEIPPCTTGKHSTVNDTPTPKPTPATTDASAGLTNPTEQSLPPPAPRLPQPQAAQNRTVPAPAPPESDTDDPSLSIADGQACRRRGCGALYKSGSNREGEECKHHPGVAIFHEGSKGWTCCKRRVLEFDEFMGIEGCATKGRHLFVGSGKKKGSGDEQSVDTVRHDFYQTSTSVIASLYLKKIDSSISSVSFTPHSIDLDLRTSDKKRYQKSVELYGSIDPGNSSFKIMGTKLELSIAKADGASWPVLRADEPHTGQIIQTGRAGQA